MEPDKAPLSPTLLHYAPTGPYGGCPADDPMVFQIAPRSAKPCAQSALVVHYVR